MWAGRSGACTSSISAAMMKRAFCRLGEDEEAFYFLQHWVPGDQRILFTDNHLNLYEINLETGRSSVIATQDPPRGL
jgi:hypothetical protein